MTDLVVHDAAEVVTPDGDGGVGVVRNGAVAIEDEEVVAVGPTDEVTAERPPGAAGTAIDAAGKTVLPGFVDPHTHAVFAGDRSDEFAAKLRGADYQEILESGGGIHRTVRAVREASRETLVSNLLGHLDAMLAHGTTTAEVKSGYGLDVESELGLLAAIDEADDRHPVDLVPTFMGAHAVPPQTDADDYVDRVVEEQIPAVADQGIAEFCDVFCEAGVFSVAQSRRVLTAAAAAGLTPKIHAEEFEHLGGAQLAAEIGATSADHLLQATDTDVKALVEAGVTPVLLPGTAFTLATDYADAETFLEAGAPVAIATDFNPNCYSESMEFAMELACHGMRMAPTAALKATTSNAARAIDRAGTAGRLAVGRTGDLVVADVPELAHVPYNFGVSTVETVVKGGRVVSRE
jgi:imidazolonepropionase